MLINALHYLAHLTGTLSSAAPSWFPAPARVLTFPADAAKVSAALVSPGVANGWWPRKCAATPAATPAAIDEPLISA